MSTPNLFSTVIPGTAEASADETQALASSTDGALNNTGHKISALYPNIASAESVRSSLLQHGFSAQAIAIHQQPVQTVAVEGASDDSSDDTIKEVLTDGAIGAALGVGVGALGTVVLISVSATLFIASPLIAPLALMANLATVGGLLGGAIGAADKGVHYSAVVSEALAAGQVLLEVKTHNPRENTLAKNIINDALNNLHQQALASG